jgi:hypothetical protein
VTVDRQCRCEACGLRWRCGCDTCVSPEAAMPCWRRREKNFVVRLVRSESSSRQLLLPLASRLKSSPECGTSCLFQSCTRRVRTCPATSRSQPFGNQIVCLRRAPLVGRGQKTAPMRLRVLRDRSCMAPSGLTVVGTCPRPSP